MNVARVQWKVRLKEGEKFQVMPEGAHYIGPPHTHGATMQFYAVHTGSFEITGGVPEEEWRAHSLGLLMAAFQREPDEVTMRIERIQ